MDQEVEGSNPFTHPVPSRRIAVFGFVYAPVAQLDRAPDFESVGRRFESYRAYMKNGWPARMAELADALDLGSSAERRGGSTPPPRMKLMLMKTYPYETTSYHESLQTR